MDSEECGQIMSSATEPDSLKEDSKDEPISEEMTEENKDSKDEPISEEMPEENKDSLKMDSTEGPINKEINEENKDVIEDNSKTGESNVSKAVVNETDVIEDNSKTAESNVSKEVENETASEAENANAGQAEAKTGMQTDDDASESRPKRDLGCLERVMEMAKKNIADATSAAMKSDDKNVANPEKKRVNFIPIDLGEDPGELEDFTADEIKSYLKKKVREYMRDPQINRMLRVQREANRMRDLVKAKEDEMNRLKAHLDKITKTQERFLNHHGVLHKVSTKNMAVTVDLPLLDTPNPTIMSSTTNNVKEQIQRAGHLTLTPCGTVPKSNVSANTSGTSLLKKSPVKMDPVECIDLTDELEAPSNKILKKSPNFKTCTVGQQVQVKPGMPNTQHPAPLPIMPNRVNRYLKEAPPKPKVKIGCDDKGIILQWDADINERHEKVPSFEIFGYQEQRNLSITSALWKRIGSVKTLSLPMACTLTKFVPGNTYHFTVRGLDVHNRPGIFSDPVSTRFEPVAKKT